jgi:CheY-like chemotaxis protein
MNHSIDVADRSLADERTTEPETPAPAPHETRAPRSGAYAPVLIVEDDPDLREMMAQLLLLEGFNAHTVANGREALDYLHEESPPELILLDLMMPVMDGWEFRREQRRDPKLASLPVIVLSALDPTRVGDLGEIAFLKKPLDFDRLLDLVRRYCRPR